MALLAIVLPAFVAQVGCQLGSVETIQSAPAVSRRFTTNPLGPTSKKDDPPQPSSMVPTLSLGLAMQSGIDAVETQFATRLGPVLVRELQLSQAAVAVEPLATLQPRIPVSTLSPQAEGDVISVAFSEPQQTLPGQLPPNPMLVSAAPPMVDQILVVRVIEYRPYFPVIATLELRVLDGESQTPLFATTATWSGVDYRLDDVQPKRTWKDKLLCREVSCAPSPGHNSPQALMHEISRDITEWYNVSLNPPGSADGGKRTSFRSRFRSPFQKKPCSTCDPSTTSQVVTE